MASLPTDLLSDALALPARERAKIAHELLLSLDEGADPDAAEAWVAELEQRAAEVRSGSATPKDWASVKARLADRWRRR
jgi:putative addiction module component (TIGR02574 family)